MKVLTQTFKDGALDFLDVPTPTPRDQEVVILTKCSLLSAGTERMLANFARASMLEKVTQNPDRVKKLVAKVVKDGVAPTISAVKSQLNEPTQLGYCNVGIVIDIGRAVTKFKVGDMVLSNGPHAEVVCVQQLFCAKVPVSMDPKKAVFGVVASIGLQSLRVAKPEMGETFVVFGLGLIGLLTAQLLMANGCRVIGVDINKEKLKLARSLGCVVVNGENPGEVRRKVVKSNRDEEVDGVIVCASATGDSILKTAGELCRRHGRIVLVGVVNPEFDRDQFYTKELKFSVAKSYGSGRNEEWYEKQGWDLPAGYLRWTVQRNFEAALELIASKSFKTDVLVSAEYSFDDAASAYDQLMHDESSLGLILNYSADEGCSRCVNVQPQMSRYSGLGATSTKNLVASSQSKLTIGAIGAGNYASRVLLPAFSKLKSVNPKVICSLGGINAARVASRLDYQSACTDGELVFNDPAVDAVIIASNHDTHADYVCRGLDAGKHVFVEKPLALDFEQIERIEECYRRSQERNRNLVLMVGFNRRFSPLVKKMKMLLDQYRDGPAFCIFNMNAGWIPRTHWVHDPDLGGGRIVGEACHYIDLLCYLCGAEVIEIEATGAIDRGVLIDDIVSITARMADGSVGIINYYSNGSSLLSKERIEVNFDGKSLVIDNFKKLKGSGFSKRISSTLWAQNKGQHECANAFVGACIQNEPSPIPESQIFSVARWTLIAAQKVKSC
mgnify:CR=1 FL=1